MRLIGFLAAIGSIQHSSASNFSNIYESAGYQVHVPIEYNDQSCIQGTFHPNSTNLFTVEVTTENEAPGAPKQHFKSKKKLSINPGLSTCYRSGLNGKSTCVSELELATGIMKKGCSQNFMPETGPVNHPCGGIKSGFLCVWDNRPMSNFHSNLMVYEWQRMRDAFFLGAIFKFLLAVLIVVALYRFCMSVCDTGIPA
jgi:hypothetical protein